ncbi:ATP-dependent zinc metalloprotease FtsH [Desulfofustis limnaeus]|jgi:cell division protease FtsH|uniref:ATP-dependent zinc metalloprotease FtsH n=1 Tax=Desulfofustis limnaeus TaxID=2740163 RepID=A0ABN6M7Q7_9BACT|nr:ATP-dependent zinc metalloprotease FtsH [Desulfofustis limnaeus]MDX9895613.1 ATP-dependent zinc metalloprotease FtsH [Desulfofustis sp.]BDD87975.1 ATP-dependent zinc metalloprotease FtsH [Desulfofustis limnaeus]
MKKKVFYLSAVGTICIMMTGVVLFAYLLESRKPVVPYSLFVDLARGGEIDAAELKGNAVIFTGTDGRVLQTTTPLVAHTLALLDEKEIGVRSTSEIPQWWWSFLVITLPVILVLWLLFSLSQKRQPANGAKEGDLARQRLNQINRITRVNFQDVAGIPEVLVEIREIVDFLNNIEKFSKLGASIPKGVLLQGPPGTGKTLLARAIADEASVPFYFFSGSDFVEMFVGVGASRVRDLFAEAKKNAPCIVFIDEIDAVGLHRSSGIGLGGQEERSQTLNALLVEMDGFSREDTIIVLAATNRPDILDPALLRPGRFDRVITILPPDVKGRRQILAVHASKIAMDHSVDLDEVARSTPGFTGAELANLVNEAALIAARKNQSSVTGVEFHEARDRIVIGVERKGFVLSDDDKRTIAFHEAGHAVLARFLPHTDPVQKITIIPRGKAMGHMQQQTLSERQTYTRDYLLDRLTVLLGGRAAEELALHQVSSGSEDDLLRATDLSTRMICQWGMNDVLGPVAYAKNSDGFLGGPSVALFHGHLTGGAIDAEVRKLIDHCYQRASRTLSEQRYYLEKVAEILLQTEALDEEELDIIFECSQKLHPTNGQTDESSLGKVCEGCPAHGRCSPVTT